MKKTNVDFNPDDLLRQMPKDFSQYMEDRLSTKQLEQATTLIYNDPEMKRIADEKLQNAFYYWEKLQPFRQRRKKCRDFYQGDHWKDTMTNPDTGETITMEDYIRS